MVNRVSLGVAIGACTARDGVGEERRAMSKPCPKRDGLFDRWNATSNALRDLEALKIGAIRDGDPQVAQWDARIQEAQEDERLAQREYERHIAIHGCNE